MAFAAFSTCFGIAHVLPSIITPDDPLLDAFSIASGFFGVASAIAAVFMAFSFPKPLDPPERRHLRPAAVVAGSVFLIGLLVTALRIDEIRASSPLFSSVSVGAVYSRSIGLYSALCALLFFLILTARRYLSKGSDRQFRAQAVLLSAALVLYPGFVAGSGASGRLSLLNGQPGSMAIGFTLLAVMVYLAIRWLRNSAYGMGARGCRNVAWLCLGTPLLGFVHHIGTEAAGTTLGGYGVVRTVAVIVLAYAILKHQLLGLDLRLKWTIRRGTLAGFFVFVFFMAGQIAQSFLDDSSSWILSGVFTGLLLFAISPIQRMAERVADAAMPGVRNSAEYLQFRKFEVYKAALTSAYRDGVITDRERDVLTTLERELGINPVDARSMESEIGRSVASRVPRARPRSARAPAP